MELSILTKDKDPRSKTVYETKVFVFLLSFHFLIKKVKHAHSLTFFKFSEKTNVSFPYPSPPTQYSKGNTVQFFQLFLICSSMLTLVDIN